MTRNADYPAALPSLSALTLTALLLTPGTPTAADSAAPTESQVLATFSLTGVRPTLSDLANAGANLTGAVRALCERPDAAGLERARAAWRTAYLAWRRAEPFQFGALKALELGKRIGKEPANTTVLDGAVTSPELGHLLRSPDARGYAAAEFLLFVPGDARTATRDQRCAHLTDTTAEIADLTALALAVWRQESESGFRAAGDGAPFLLPGDALSLPIAEALNVTERMLRDRIGPASGFFEGPADPERLEAWHSGTSREALRASLEGLRLLMLGDGATGVAALVATRDGVLSRKDPKLAARLERRFAKSIAELDDTGRPLHEELRDQPNRLKRLYREVERLQKDIEEVTLVLELDVLPTNMQPAF
ncbi:imelysin family protein [Thiocystis violascens]|uniref:Putative periplasmic lipoprotein n=1 Tax=Thiocystis violascens (strain ATCC 17096 / DSM 198 / 6111) TaxID=765911 RepID=I3Y5I2_THIV6|nr:imelysin family protein [Thiocystis violascens]AFL72250.1 putative periplasmic lipoprotein [Thiocystis violascens DSM 198]